MTDYLLRYLTHDGVFVENISDFSHLKYAGRENEIGIMTLTLPAELMNPVLDGRLEIYRQVGAGGYNLEFDTQWFIRYWKKQRQGNVSSLLVKAYTGNELLSRRIIGYAADTPQTNKTAHIDDMMKAFVRENCGTLATDTGRNLSTYLSVQGDFAGAPIHTKAASWKNLVPVLQELAETSMDMGTYLVFDTVKLTDIQMEFRTYIGQRGVNRGSTGASPLLVSDVNGSLSDTSLEYDYSSEGNYIYCGGRNEGIDRVVAEEEDTTRSLATVLNRREIFKDSRQTEDQEKVVEEAQASLNANRPRIIFNGTLVDTDDIQYGVDYGFGDIVEAQYEDTVMDCHVNAVEVDVQGGKEVLTIKLRGEQYV